MDTSEPSQPAEAAGGSQPPGSDWFDAPDDEGDHPDRRHKPSMRAWIAGGVGAAVLAVGGIVGIHAASSSAQTASSNGAAQGPGGMGQGPGGGQGFGGRGTVGKITKIDGSTLTVAETQMGPPGSSSSSSSSSSTTVTVKTSGSTTVTQTTTGSLSDIKVGDHVQVMGTGSSTAITAVRITDGASDSTSGGGFGGGFGGGTPPGASGSSTNGQSASGQSAQGRSGQSTSGQGQAGGGGFGPGGASGMTGASGTVVSIDGSTITLTATDGSSVTVTTSSSTTVELVTQSSVSKLAVGDTVMVQGTTSGSTVTATEIREGQFGFGRPDDAAGAGAAGGPGGSGSGGQ